MHNFFRMNLRHSWLHKLRGINWSKVKGLAAKSFKVSILLVVIFEVIPNVGEFWYTAREAKKEAAIFANQEAVNLLHLASYDYERALEKVEQLLMVLAEVPELLEPRLPRCSQFLEKIRKQYPIYANLGVILNDGDSVCSAVQHPAQLNLADRLYFSKVVETKRFSIGEFQIGRITQKPTVNFGYPLLDTNKNLRAVLYAAIDLNELKELTIKAGLPMQASFFILDENGKFLVRYPDSENLVGHEIQDREVLKKIKSGGEQIFELDKMYASTKLRSATEAGSIYIAVGVPKFVFLSRFDKIFNARLFQEGVSTFLQILFAWAAGFMFLWQLKKLDKAAMKINQGDLSARTNVKAGFGEIERLSATFDQMAEHLEAENKRLQFLSESARRLCQVVSLDARFKKVTEIAVEFFCDICTIQVKGEDEVTAKSGEGEIFFSIKTPIIVFEKEFGIIIFAKYKRSFEKFDYAVAEDIAAYIGLVVENARLKPPLSMTTTI